MYKVDPADRIPVRTPEQAGIDDLAAGGFVGPAPEDHERIFELEKKLVAVMREGNKPVRFVRLIHQLADLLNTGTVKHAVCQRGCSYCCTVPVTISLIEAEYIARKTGNKIHNDRRGRGGGYCPFHDEKTASCGAYEFRPMACRVFFTFDDPEYCKDNSKIHAISTIGGKSGNEFVAQMGRWLVEASNWKKTDIRNYFDPVKGKGRRK